MAWFFRSAEWLQHFYYYWKSLLPKVSATSLTVEWWTSAQILWQVNCPLTKQLNFKANLMGIRLGVGVGLLFQPSEEADFLHVSCWCLHSEGTCSHVPIVWSIQEKCFLQLKKAAVSTSAKKKPVIIEPPLNVILDSQFGILCTEGRQPGQQAGQFRRLRSWKEGHQLYCRSVLSGTSWILGAPRCCLPTWKNLGLSFPKVLREMYNYKAYIIHATFI